jgi:hypothetical protein
MLHAVTGAEPATGEISSGKENRTPDLQADNSYEKLIQENHPDGTPSRNRTMLMKLKSKQTPRSRDSTEGKTNCTHKMQKKIFFIELKQNSYNH